MAATCSFDVTSTVDLQEVDNALNQARKEVVQRYDFKGSKAVDRVQPAPRARSRSSPTTSSRCRRCGRSSRGAWSSAQRAGEEPEARRHRARRRRTRSAASSRCSRASRPTPATPIVKFLKDRKLKKVQAAIQGDQLRISSPSRDELQARDRAAEGAGLRRRAAVRQLPRVLMTPRPASLRRPSGCGHAARARATAVGLGGRRASRVAAGLAPAPAPVLPRRRAVARSLRTRAPRHAGHGVPVGRVGRRRRVGHRQRPGGWAVGELRGRSVVRADRRGGLKARDPASGSSSSARMSSTASSTV